MEFRQLLIRLFYKKIINIGKRFTISYMAKQKKLQEMAKKEYISVISKTKVFSRGLVQYKQFFNVCLCIS